MKSSMMNSEEIFTNKPYEKSIYFLLSKNYQINLISTILYILSNNRANMKITILHIILMFIPNFFSLIYLGLYWDEITNLICFSFIIYFIIFIRETIFEFFINSKGSNYDVQIKDDSKTKINTIYNQEEIIKPQQTIDRFDAFFSYFEKSKNFYFEIVNNKINLTSENFKFFIVESLNKFSDKINNTDVGFKAKNNWTNNIINDKNIEFKLIHYMKGLKLYKIYDKDFNEEKIKSFLNFVHNKKIIYKENYSKENKIVDMEEIQLSNQKDIDEIYFFNQTDSLFTFIDNLNKFNNKKAKFTKFKSDIVNHENIKNNKLKISKLNIQDDKKAIINKNAIDSNVEINNSSCQNIIRFDSKNILENLKNNVKRKEKMIHKKSNYEMGTLTKVNKIQENYQDKESSHIINNHSDSECNIKKTDKFIISNSKSDNNQKEEIQEIINGNNPERKKCFINIGLYKLNLLEIFEWNENSLNDYKSINFNKKAFGIFYFDISAFLSIMDCGSIKIEICLKNVSDYFYSYEKLKSKFFTKSLKISKLIHEFKTQIDCIIGLSSEIQILTEEKYNSNPYKLINEDIDRIQHLSNYTVFLIKDLISILSNSDKNKKNEQNKSISMLKSDSIPNIEEKQSDLSSCKRLTQRRDAKMQKIIRNNKLIKFKSCSLNEILNFTFSILTS